MSQSKWAGIDAMSEITVNFGPGQLSLLDLMNDWSARVLKFYGGLDANWSDRDPGIWGGDDLIGSYHLRDAIESGLDLLDSATGLREVAILTATDELLLSFTVDDLDEWLAVFDRTLDPGTGWWWQRMPGRGPVFQHWAELRMSSS